MRIFFLVQFMVFVCVINAQTFYAIDSVQEIKIYFGINDWDYRMDTAKAGSETYLLADSVVINGTRFLNCGVKYKGNSSYDVSRKKNPLHIKLDKWIDQNYQGYEDIKLGNGFGDNSMIREPLSYLILRQYMDAPLGNFAKVYINDAYYGIMNNAESIENTFLLDKFYSSKHTFIKCNPPTEGPGAGNGANLAYNGTAISSYDTKYELKSDSGWYELIQLCDTLNNHFSAFNSVADIDRFIWMLAFNNVLVNLDSYTGSFRQNYYMYRNHAGQWIPIVWDLNMSMGGFAVAGGTTSNLTPTTMQTMSYTLHKNESEWPLIYKLLNDPFYTKMYYAHLRTINTENFANAGYKTTANAMQAMVDNAVVTDTNYLGTYTDFQAALTSNTSLSSGGTCPGIFPLMDGRANYLTNVLSATPPAISNVSSTGSLQYGDTAYITASISNQTNVYLGYRYGKQHRFVRIPMYDDGAHNDGTAGDGTFGASIPVQSLSVQYYIYAENANTGVFSPERAEHEFYSLSATLPTAVNGEVVLNEITTNSKTGIQNENGKCKDWIELYNTTNKTLALTGLFLSDNATDLSKWNFPAKSLILPNEHLLVWADDLDKTHLDLHTNFNLSDVGDALYLSNGTTLFDSYIFGSLNTDEALARCPDGVGAFNNTFNRTPRLINDCSVEIQDVPKEEVTTFPNPANEEIYITSSHQLFYAELLDINGKTILQTNEHSINVHDFPNGVYFVLVNTVDGARLKKVVVVH